MRKKFIDISKQVLFALNVLILFFLLFERYLEIPAWLQVFGRMHPMFLHFPIVILLLAIALDFLLPREDKKTTFRKTLIDTLFLVGSLTASLTVIMGLFLSLEEQSLSPTLQLHKWAGVSIAALGYLIVHLRQVRFERQVWIRSSYFAVGLSVVLAGHLGSVLTHGQNFLWEPVRGEDEIMLVSLDEALIFDHVIKPVLKAKCMGCHNEAKAKGDLIMLDSVLLEKGGENGTPFVRGDPHESLMIQRANLPLEHKDHMPPEGKPQLTSEEHRLLTLWIKAGAPFNKRVIAMDTGDSLRLLAESRLAPADDNQPMFTFTAAQESDIRSLRTDYRVIAPIAFESPALAVNFYNRHVYSSESLAELNKISKQIVWLDLNKMPVSDDDLKTIATFENLEKLNLNFTDITGVGLKYLSTLRSLTELSISGTQVTASGVEDLAPIGKLRALYLWQTGVRDEDLAGLRKRLPGVTFEMGFHDDGTMLKLNLPRFENELAVFKDTLQLQLSHPVRATHIRFTTDGTDPDSLHGHLYEGPIKLGGTVTLVKSRAYKEGWLGSDVASRYFLRSALSPDSIVLATPPAPEYKAAQPGLLTDGETTNPEFRSGNWLGYRANDAEILFHFGQPVTTSSVTLSTLNSTPSYIFPAAEVEVWGALHDEPMERLGSWRPSQPDSLGNTAIDVKEYNYDPKEVTTLKIIARPVGGLPSWHPAKGEKAWVFLNEILVN